MSTPLFTAGCAVMTLGIGTLLNASPTWFALACIAIGLLFVVLEVVMIAHSHHAAEKASATTRPTPEQIGAALYSHSKAPLAITLTFAMPPEKREIYMRLVAKRKGTPEERFSDTLAPVMIRAVDDYLERHR